MKDTILTVIRTLLIAGGGILSSKGVLQSSDVEAIAGASVSLVGAVWVAIAQKKALNTPVPPAK